MHPRATDPRNISRVAQALGTRLAELDPERAAHYRARLNDTRWHAAMMRWQTQATPLKGTPIVVQHWAFPCLEDWLGLKQVSAPEPRAGVEPSLGQSWLKSQRNLKARRRAVIRVAYQNPRRVQWLPGHADIPIVVGSFIVDGLACAKDLFGLFDDTLWQRATGLACAHACGVWGSAASLAGA